MLDKDCQELMLPMLETIKLMKLSLAKYLFAGILTICLFPSVAQNSFYKLTASKDHASGKTFSAADTVVSLLNFAIPHEIEVMRGNAGNGELEFRFRTHDNKLVTCTYRGGASQADPVNKKDIATGRTYRFERADAPYWTGDVVTTDFVKLDLIRGAPSFGITEAQLSLDLLKLPKEKINPPYPRLNGEPQKSRESVSSTDPSSLRTVSTNTPSNRSAGSPVTSLSVISQPESLCANSLTICSPVMIREDGYYENWDINQINGQVSCLRNGSINGIWYSLTAVRTGHLNFTLKPEKITDDYDWAVYDITNYSCEDINNISSLEIACNFDPKVGDNGWTGPNGNTTGGTQFAAPVNVVAGRTYKIFISLYNHGLQVHPDSAPERGFTLDLSQSLATGSSNYIFDALSATVSASANAICTGSFSQLKATMAETGQYTYQWSPSTGLDDPAISNPIARPSVTTSYSVTITGANQVCKSTPPSVTVKVLDPPAHTDIVVKGTTCVDPPTGEISFQVRGSADTVRIWGGNIPGQGEVLIPVEGVYTRTGLSSATYQIATASAGGCISSSNVQVNYDGLTFSQMCDANVASTISTCSIAGLVSTSAAGFTVASANSSGGTYSYDVYNAKGTRISPPEGYIGTIGARSTIPGLTGGIYRIEVTSVTGCMISTTDAGNRALKVEPMKMTLGAMLHSNQDTLLIPDNHVFKYCSVKPCGENIEITAQLNLTNLLACTDLSNLRRTFKLFRMDAHGTYKLLLIKTSTNPANTHTFTLARGRLMGKYKIEASLENYGCANPLLFEVQAQGPPLVHLLVSAETRPGRSDGSVSLKPAPHLVTPVTYELYKVIGANNCSKAFVADKKGPIITHLAPGKYCVKVRDSRGNEMSCMCHDFEVLKGAHQVTSTALLWEQNSNEQTGRVQVRPNPVDHTLYVDVPGETAFTAELRSLEGRLLKQSSDASIIGIDVSDLPQGLYLLFMRTDKGTVVKRVEVLRGRKW